MRRSLGIVVQITLLMVLVVFPAVFLLNKRMSESAGDIVVDHEKVDLNEETQLQAWHLRSGVDLLRQDIHSAADAVVRAMHRGRDVPIPATQAVTQELLKTALPDQLLARYQRVEVFPYQEGRDVPQKLADRCELVSAAEEQATHSRTELLERIRRRGRPLEVMLAPAFYRESQPFVLKPGAVPALREHFATDEDGDPVIWPRNYHVLWGGVRVPTNSPDKQGDWILLIALGLDESFRGIAGSPRHLGFLFDQSGTLYLHPTQNHELTTDGHFQRKTDASFEMFERPLLNDFKASRRQAAGLEIGAADIEPRTLKEGHRFFFSETDDLDLSKEQKQQALRLIRQMNYEFLENEWALSSSETAGHQRVAGIQTDQFRIRMLASNPKQLAETREFVESRLRDGAGIEHGLSWRMQPVECSRCLASQIRIELVPSGNNRDSTQQLTLIRAAFDEELAADLTAELYTVEWDAYMGGLIAVVVAFGLSLLITWPLKRITRSAQAISQAVGQQQGNESPELNGYLERLPERRPDEIGELARAFRNLVRQVQEYATAIRERESFLRGIHDTAMDGIMTVDEGGRICSFNPAAEQIFCWPAEEVIGKHFEILYPPAVAAELKRNLESFLATGEAKLLGRRSEFVGRRRDGSMFPLELSISEIEQANGKRIFASLLRDVTERKEAERARDLLVANEEKTHALREIAHETLNDLTAILGAADQYRRRFGDSISAKQSMLLARIEKSGRSLVEFVEDLRDIARINEGTTTLELAEFSPGEVIEDALATLRPKFLAKEQRVYVEIDGAPRSIQADKGRFRQLVKNLLSNACKYTPQGGTITVRARAAQDDHLRIEVSDTGIGIPDEDREKIFKDFTRARNAESQAAGQGLGLALCKRIVEMHSGTIDFESKLGEGTTFWVQLPLRSREPGGQTSEAGGDVRIKVVSRGYLIFVADSNQPRADELTEMLRGDGHAVDVFNDGEQLVAEVATVRPDMIFTVLNLPGLTARDAVEQIRALPGGNSIAIVLLTRADVPDVESLGFTHRLRLPVEQESLRRVIIDASMGTGSPIG